MSKMQKGPKAAAQILNLLNPDEKKRILQQIDKQDHNLAQEITAQLVEIDDLEFITAHMLSEFLKSVSQDELGLALRLANTKTKDHIVKLLPTAMAKEIRNKFDGPPQSKNLVYEAHAKVLIQMRKQIDSGKLVLKRGGETLV